MGHSDALLMVTKDLQLIKSRLENCFKNRLDLIHSMGFPGGSDGKESTCNARDLGSTLGLGRSPGGGNVPTPVFVPGECRGQRNPMGYSPWGRKEPDMTE